MLIVPWRETDCMWRRAALGLVMNRRRAEGFEPQITVSYPDTNWIKAVPVWKALGEYDLDAIAVMHDADVWCPPSFLHMAIAAVESGTATWALPHRKVFRLSPESSRRFCNGMKGEWCNDLDQEPYDGIPGGGIVVARVGTLRETPLDPRFIGWGQEDESWGAALTTLYGEPWRGEADLIHLWHPPQERLTRTRGSMDGWLLRVCYCEAFGNPERMRALVDKARHALEITQPRLHDHPSSPVLEPEPLRGRNPD